MRKDLEDYLYLTTTQELELILSPPLVDFGLSELSEIVDICDLAGDGTLDHFDATADESAFADGIGGGDGLDLDDADAGIVLAAVVHAVAQVAQPGLERRAVVFLHHAAVRDDACCAGNRCPAAVSGQESNVDVRVRFKVRCLACLCVGVEE